MTLSFCMIVRDEEELLPFCLASVRDFVDEMIVVDTGSTDRTIAIAESFGAQIHTFEWCNDFAAARNVSLKHATGDWVLVLDADEVLVPEVVPVIQKAMQDEQRLVINLVRQEAGAAQAPYSLVSRLFRRHPDLQFNRPYHAMIDDRVTQILQREPHWQIGYLSDVAILHEGYRADTISARGKLQKACTIMETFLAENPHDPYVCSKLGALYVEMGAAEKGLALLHRGLETIQQTQSQGTDVIDDSSTLYELHYHLGSIYAELQNPDRSGQHYQAAIQQPVLPKLKLGAINNWGNLLKEAGDLKGAKSLYRQALQIDPKFAIGYYNLGMTLKAMGEFVAAIAHYKKAIALNPDYAEAYQNLGVVLLRVGQVVEGLEAFQQAIVLYNQRQAPEGEQLHQSLLEMGFTVMPELNPIEN